MLPRLLCEELCSLNPGVDRLAFSVIWKLDSQGNIVDEPFFGRTIICSRAKLSYEHAQNFIEGHESWEAGRKAGKDLKPVELSGDITEGEIKKTVLDLWGIAKAIRKTRYDNGALSLNNVKLWFSLSDEGNPQACGIHLLFC
jgi:exoribonuclease R